MTERDETGGAVTAAPPARGTLAAVLDGRLSPLGRVLIVAATLAILPCLFLPTWTISLRAPQYPQGLEMQIHPTTVEGDLSEVNILNHYIGMHTIDPDEFQEFRFIPFFILRFFALALLAALVGRMAVAALGWIDFVIFGAVMLYTLQHWLYDYGNNLDPAAPLDFEPFTPKFLGTTTIGQFEVTSMPAAGAVLMIAAGALGPLVLLYEWRRQRRS